MLLLAFPFESTGKCVMHIEVLDFCRCISSLGRCSMVLNLIRKISTRADLACFFVIYMGWGGFYWGF